MLGTIVIASRRLAMQIFVKTLDGKINISVVVGPNDTVGNVKAKIEDQTGFSVEEQQLLFGGAKVEDRKR